ncbi:Bni5p [Saccharomyces eubayanus]|uniref:Bni5p n=1 Tax=Saccharomyces eubayanus TaxID=1080349 RepID=UPI0006BEF558|nr:BNI5-like protein [Saccharomyces eubayanus]KOG96998.1 BNI5-like protein [Saccharomyces eubayanus]
MGLDQDKIKKRLSQIEIDINQMNQMIDENLQLVEPTENEAAKEIPEVGEATEAAFPSSNEEFSNTREDAVQPEAGNESPKEHIFSDNEKKKSMETEPEQLEPQVAVVQEIQVNHTAIVIGDSYNAFVAKSAKNAESNDSDTEVKAYDTENVNQSGVDNETAKSDDDEWEDEKSDAEDKCTGKEEVEKIEAQPLKPPTRETISYAGHRTADTELILDNFSSGNDGGDPNILPQTISVGSKNDDNHENKHLADQTTDTSEDFPNPSGRSTPLDSQSKIFIPKKNLKEDDTDANDSDSASRELKPVPNFEKRRPTNPFRVISVSSNSGSRDGSRKSSLNKYDTPASSPITSASELGNTAKLEKRHDYLAMKCTKLQKEIDYLNKMNAQGSLSMDDGKRLKRAVVKLQEYLDSKTKEKYEVGVLLSRQLRKQIDRGENGQFWIGTK